MATQTETARVGFQTAPGRYRHWRLEVDPPVAFLYMDVDQSGGLGDYELKLNSYDLGVDVELHDAVQRLRFEHPEVGAIVITGAKDKVFCAGANIRMLAQASHSLKVNFCKFTNETRLAMEDASANSSQVWIAALNGTASGGGYELALACDHIILADDGSSAVSLPELPLLGVLPGTGGLTRLIDKRGVRRDVADVVCTRAEGVRGSQALRWNLVDELAPRTSFVETATRRARERARPRAGRGIELRPLARTETDDAVTYTYVSVTADRELGTATIMVRGPESPLVGDNCEWWPIAAALELDDAILHLRLNEPELGTIVLRTSGDAEALAAADEALLASGDWLPREVVLLWKRVLKRLDQTARTIVALVEPDSCFAGTLLELALAADRSFMLDVDAGPYLTITGMNLGPLPMANGLTRLQSRGIEGLRSGDSFGAAGATARGIVTFAPDELDWDDEVRVALEERAGFSPDALTGLEANLRFPGAETMESKIFGRLSAWQNWIFQRPNAMSALKSYGTGIRPSFDRSRT
jgi:benzoyl-CoA-dihydrodiol lyase